MKQVYPHDCEACTHLGHYNGHDLYHCPQHGVGPTVIARYGNDRPEYASGLVVAAAAPFHMPDMPNTIRALRVAWLIAKDMGLQL